MSISREDRASETELVDSPGEVGNDAGEAPAWKFEVLGDGSVLAMLSVAPVFGVIGVVEDVVGASEMRDMRRVSSPRMRDPLFVRIKGVIGVSASDPLRLRFRLSSDSSTLSLSRDSAIARRSSSGIWGTGGIAIPSASMGVKAPLFRMDHAGEKGCSPRGSVAESDRVRTDAPLRYFEDRSLDKTKESPISARAMVVPDTADTPSKENVDSGRDWVVEERTSCTRGPCSEAFGILIGDGAALRGKDCIHKSINIIAKGLKHTVGGGINLSDSGRLRK